MKSGSMLLVLCLSLYAQHLPWLYAEGGLIRNSAGDTLAFRGIHLTNESWGDWNWPESDSIFALGNKDPFFPQKTFPKYSLEERDFENIKNLSPFLVRYELSYNVFAKDNPLRESNMEILKKHITRFNDMGIYVVPVLHFGPGLHLSAASYEDKNHGDVRLKSIFEDTTFFEQHCQWWEFVATQFRDNPGVAAYQIIVEPRIPSQKDGGWNTYKDRMTTLCKRIRAIDRRHLLVTHHAHSREANPGEEYWSNSLEKMVTDTGEQGILWPSDPNYFVDSLASFFLIDMPNIIYSFSVYTPYGFCSMGATNDFNGESFTDDNFRKNLQEFIKPRVQFGLDNSVPILIDEYGVNHQQSREDVLRWLKVAHELFDSYNLPSWYFLYKLAIDIHSGNLYNYGLFSYFSEFDGNIVITDSGYQYTNETLKMKAIESEFDSLFSQYFWNEGEFQPLSIMNNGMVYDYMKKYLNQSITKVTQKRSETTADKVMVTNGKLFLSKELKRQHRLSLFTLQGKQLWKKELEKMQRSIAIPQSGSGIHILRISGDEVNLSLKILTP